MSVQNRRTVMLIIGENESQLVQSRLLYSGLVLAKYISADLVMCLPSLDQWPSTDVFSHIKEPTQFKFEVTAFGKNSDFVDSIEAKIRETDPTLLIMDRNHLTQARTKRDQILRKKLFSEIKIPILLVMCHQKELKIPFSSIFVPMSGEARSSPALEWSLKFANEMNLPVDILHVTHRSKGVVSDSSLIGRVCDEFHHEYPHLISNFVLQGSPYSSMKERKVIRHFIHCSGIELKEIIKRGCEQPSPLVVVEWKGNAEKGHAKVLKGILAQTDWPILLTLQNLNHIFHFRSLSSSKVQ